MAVYFLGVDLAWKIPPKRPSATVVLNEECKVTAYSLPLSDEEIVNFSEKYSRDACFIGIDAPLVVANETGARACEVELMKKHRISSYPANKKWFKKAFGGVRGAQLVADLEQLGFRMHDRLLPRVGALVIMEVYPYSILAALLGRGNVPSYKKGNKTERVNGIEEIMRRFAALDPPLELDFDASSPMGHDLLDAAIAAYTVHLYWRYGEERCEVIGDAKRGFILVPRPSA